MNNIDFVMNTRMILINYAKNRWTYALLLILKILDCSAGLAHLCIYDQKMDCLYLSAGTVIYFAIEYNLIYRLLYCELLGSPQINYYRAALIIVLNTAIILFFTIICSLLY